MDWALLLATGLVQSWPSAVPRRIPPCTFRLHEGACTGSHSLSKQEGNNFISQTRLRDRLGRRKGHSRYAPSDGQPACHTQCSRQEASFIGKMPLCRRTASLPLEASCQRPGTRHLRGRYQQRQPGRQARCTSSSGARQPADQITIDHLGAHSAHLPAEVEAKKAVPKSEEAERMRQLSGNTTRTRKVFVGGLPPSVDETAFRWVGTLKRGLQAASASHSCCRPSTHPHPTGDLSTPHRGTPGGLAHDSDATRLGTDALLAAGSTLNSLERWRRQW